MKENLIKIFGCFFLFFFCAIPINVFAGEQTDICGHTFEVGGYEDVTQRLILCIEFGGKVQHIYNYKDGPLEDTLTFEYKSWNGDKWYNVKGFKGTSMFNYEKRSDGGYTYSYSDGIFFSIDKSYLDNAIIHYSAFTFTLPNGDVIEPPKVDVIEDIPNFGWVGDGIRILTPSDGVKIKGYTHKGNGTGQSGNYKYYDIVLYGKYISKNGLFDTVDSIKGYIQNSIHVTHNGITKRVGDGVGVKDFEWVKPPKNGEEAQFKVVLYQGMWKSGISDLNVELTVKHYNGEKLTFSDSSKNVNLLSDNLNDNLYEPPVDDDDAIGGEWNDNLDGTIADPSNKPDRPDSLNPVDWIIYIIEYITHLVTSLINALTTIINEVVKAFSGLINEFTTAISKFTQIFGMLPSPMPQLITLSLTTVCLSTIVKFIRG